MRWYTVNVADEPRRRPSSPAMAAFVAPTREDRNGNHPPTPPSTPSPTLPRRSPEVIEQLLEASVAKLESLRNVVDRMHDELATKEQVRLVYEQARRTHRLLEQHMREEKEERAQAALRQEAIMSMLGQILAKLPDPVRSPSATPTQAGDPEKT